MNREYEKLKKVEAIIDISRPLAKNKKVQLRLGYGICKRETLKPYINSEYDLYDRLTAVAHLMRRLHQKTETSYRKDKEFARFHRILSQAEFSGHNP